MPKVTFLPSQSEVEVDESTKLLVAARRAEVDIRFGCASCRCGTCGVEVNTSSGQLKDMSADERELLTKISLPTDGSVRLACQARIVSGNVEVDLDFQNKYSPDSGLD